MGADAAEASRGAKRSPLRQRHCFQGGPGGGDQCFVGLLTGLGHGTPQKKRPGRIAAAEAAKADLVASAKWPVEGLGMADGVVTYRDVPLADSIRIYKRGAALKARCESQLKDAQLEVDQIVMGPEGPRTEPGRERLSPMRGLQHLVADAELVVDLQAARLHDEGT